VREADGLAMSSRNAYLNAERRKSALILYRSLMAVQKRFESGERKSVQLVEAGREIFAQEPSVRLDYFEIVDPETLEPVETIAGRVLVAVAAYVGATRIIDNLVLCA
jgi:pantoate--beta-alanine ligase